MPLTHLDLRRRPRAALALTALALGAAGCGEGDAPDTAQRTTTERSAAASGDEARVRAVVEQSFKTRDPKSCTRLVTQHFLEQVTFETGAVARRECERTASSAMPARSVAISQVSVGDGKASAHAVPTGGDSDGQQVTLALVERGGAWKLDRMTALTIDRRRFDRATRIALVHGPDAQTPEQADCFVRRLQAVSDSELERALVESDRSAILRPTIKCVRDIFEETIRDELLKGERRVSPSQADCVIEGLRERLDDRELEEALEASNSESPPPKALTEALGALLSECTPNATVT